MTTTDEDIGEGPKLVTKENTVVSSVTANYTTDEARKTCVLKSLNSGRDLSEAVGGIVGSVSSLRDRLNNTSRNVGAGINDTEAVGTSRVGTCRTSRSESPDGDCSGLVGKRDEVFTAETLDGVRGESFPCN